MKYQFDQDNNLIVVLRYWITMDNIWLHPPYMLADLLYKLNYNELHFRLTDCENIQYSGFMDIVGAIVKDLELNQSHKIKIITTQKLTVDWAESVQETSLPSAHWVANYVPYEPPVNTEFERIFMAPMNRFTLFRFRMAKFLQTEFKEQSFVSFRESLSHVCGYFEVDPDIYKDEAKWAEETLPLYLDIEHRVGDNNTTYQTLMISLIKFKPRYLFEIVMETDCYNSTVFTEKTMRPMALGKPFLLFSGVGSLEYLKSFGFKTFAPFVDESYDSITNTHKRFEAVCNEIKRIGNLPRQTLLDFAAEYRPIFEHNQRLLYDKTIRDQIMHRHTFGVLPK